MGEVVEEAVVRETQEETYLTVRPIRLLNIYSYPDKPHHYRGLRDGVRLRGAGGGG